MKISIRASGVALFLVAVSFLVRPDGALAQSQPSITTQPQSQSAVAGTNITFTVAATGQSPLTYQWYFNNAAMTNSAHVSGATSSTLTLNGVVANDAGNYQVTVSNRHDVVTSSPATLTVLVPVAVTEQPTDRTVYSGAYTTFAVTIVGTGPVAFQWYFNDVPVSDGAHFTGSQSAALTINGAITNDAGNYHVQVSNAFSSATSSNALLTVLLPVAIVSHPTNRTIASGTNITFTVSAEGTAPMGYQWYFNDAPLSDGGRITGSQTGALTINGALTNDSGNYSVQVSNAFSSASSSNASLTVFDPVVITSHPTNRTVIAGTNTTFTVAVTGTAPISYQWFYNGTPLPDAGSYSGSHTANLTVSGLQTNYNGNYYVLVSNIFSSSISSNAILTVVVPPAFTQQPQSQIKITGDSVAFTTSAQGSPLVYQWLINNSPLTNSARISGADSATLVITGLTTNDAGDYSLEVSNSGGSVVSSNAALIVNLPYPGVPHIGSFSPLIAVPGTSVNIIGVNFSPEAASNIVSFGAVRATVLSASETNLLVTAPVGATHAPIAVTVNGLSGYADAAFQPTFPGNGQPMGPSTFAARQDMAFVYGNFQTVISDLDGDGKPDLAVDPYSSANPISLFRNIGIPGSLSASSFAPRVDLSAAGSSANIYGFTSADVDGDGKPELVYCDSSLSRIGIYRNISVPGSLTTSSFATPINFTVGSSPTYVRVLDLDGDGKPEIVTTCSGSATVSVLRNLSVPGELSTNSFAPPVNFVSGTGANDVAIHDLDGDGKPDLAVSHHDTAIISVFRNTTVAGEITTNSFAPKVDFPALIQNLTVFAGDIDGDGKPELLAGGKGSTLSVYRNQSSPGSITASSFAPRVDFGNPGWVHNIAMGDINGDAKSDIIIVGELGSYMAVYKNQSTPGAFGPSSVARIDYGSGYNAWGVSVGDLDGDSRPDVAFCNNYDGDISLYQNATPFSGPLFITSQPTDKTISVNTAFVVEATVIGQTPITYNWLFNGTNLANGGRISGANTASLNIANSQTNDSGQYQLIASNSFGVVTSIVANISVVVIPPSFSQQPLDQNVAVSNNATLSVSTSGSLPISYQWYFDDAPLLNSGHISGATLPTLTIFNAQTNDIGNYFVVASNAASAVTSIVAILNVGVPPSIISSPESQTNVVGSNVTFTVVADGDAPLRYQWKFNGANLADNASISGSTNSVLSISNLLIASAGNYTVVVTNAFGSVTSAPAALTVMVPPAFTVQPMGRSVVPGLPTTFSATVTGNAPLTYQWQLNNVDIPNATTTSYSITNVTTNDFGVYRLVASNAVGVTASVDAPLTPGKIVAWGRNDFGQTIIPADLTNVIMLAAGGIGLNPGHNLALRADGFVVAWGNNGFGQTNVPVGLSNVVAIAAGGLHSMALRSDGKVFAWGNNGNGQIAVPSTVSNIVTIAAGGSHSMALRSDGKLFAWGYNGYGQTNVALFPANIATIACGQYHSLAIRTDGAFMGWGNNQYGQTNPSASLGDAVGLAGGIYHSLALRSDGTTLVWGYGPYGQTNTQLSLTNAAMVTAGDYYSAALRSNGTVTVWGQNQYGQTNVPLAATNLVSISGGASHLIGLVGDDSPLIIQQPIGGVHFIGRQAVLRGRAIGALSLSYQWKFNGADIPNATTATLTLTNLVATNAGNYQLVVSNAFGVATSVPAPLTILNNIQLSFLSQPLGIQTNYQGSKVTLNFSIAGNGPLKYQWRFNGTNIAGATNQDFVFDPVLLPQAGNYSAIVSNQITSVLSGTFTQRVQTVRIWGSSYPNDISKTPLPLITNAASVAAGALHYLVLRSDGKIEGLGSSAYGETNPPPTVTNTTVRAIAAGYRSSLALLSNGIPFAWGYSGYGQTNVPVSATNVTAIASSLYHSLALRSDGTAVGWGQNSSGQTTIPFSATNLIAIAAGGNHSLALRANGTMIGWGLNGNGQITIPPSATNNIIAIAAGERHSLALRTNGTVIAWGENFRGQTNVPAGLSNVVAISASGFHSVALRSDGTVIYWGSYASGTSGSAFVPSDLVNFIYTADSGDGSIGILGTRAPAITIQPFNRTVLKNSNTVFVAKAVGAQPMSFQWLFNGTNINGATNDFLSLANLQFAQAGNYQLSVSNSYGTNASKPATLVVSLPLPESVDATSFPWTTGGSAQWFGQPATTHDQTDAAQSGRIGGNQETILQTVISRTSPGQISFWWKVSSEPGFDFLEFRVNGAVKASISGDVDWEQRTIAIGAGQQILQWRYSKNSASDVGQDTAWVDQVLFIPDPPVITQQPSNQVANMGATVMFPVTASGEGPFFYQWRKDVTNFVGSSSTLTLNNVGRAQRGVYSVVISNAGGSTTSSNAILQVLVPQQFAAPILLPNGMLQFSSADADGGMLSPADLSNLEVQASTNLEVWTTLSNSLSLTNGTLLLFDAEQTNYPARYYRIVEY